MDLIFSYNLGQTDVPRPGVISTVGVSPSLATLLLLYTSGNFGSSPLYVPCLCKSRRINSYNKNEIVDNAETIVKIQLYDGKVS